MRGLLVVVALVIGLLLALEQSARVFLFGPSAFSFARVASVQAIGRSGFLRPSDLPGVLYELAPDRDGYFQLARFRTNSRGLRDREYPLLKPEGSFRIAVLGSSVTMGPGIENERVFHAVLEERLNEGGDRPFEVISFAVGGYYPEQVLATLRHKALRWEPDLVLFSMTGRGNLLAREHPERRFRPREPTNAFFQSFLWRLVQVRLRIPERSEPGDEPTQVQRKLASQSVLESLGAIRRERGIPIVIVRLEYRDEPRPRFVGELRRAARAQDLHFVDTSPAFEGTQAEEFWIHGLDRHPNAEAHQPFASVVESFLRESELLGQ